MTPNLELVKPERERSRSSGPSWSSIGAFVGTFFAVLATAFMLAIGFIVLDLRDDAKLMELQIQRLERELAYFKGQTDREEIKP